MFTFSCFEVKWVTTSWLYMFLFVQKRKHLNVNLNLNCIKRPDVSKVLQMKDHICKFIFFIFIFFYLSEGPIKTPFSKSHLFHGSGFTGLTSSKLLL